MINTVTLTTKVILGKNIKMDRDYKNVLNYTETDMINLLESNSHLVAEISNASFVNPTGTILVPFTYDQCLKSNYMAFQNPNFSNKWFFCFIDKIIFHSKKCQEIKYTVDSWTTWWDKWSVKPCFVVREHVNDDTIGLHLKDENLDVGEYMNLNEYQTFNTSSFWIAIASSHRVWDNTDFSGITCYNKAIFGFELHLIRCLTINDLDTLIAYLGKCQVDNKIPDNVISDIFIVPYELVDQSQLSPHSFTVGGDDYKVYTLPYSLEKKYYDFTQITKPYSWQDYIPKNNKCYIYPYNYLYVTNNQGNENMYKYEDFDSETANFRIIESIGVGNSVITYPLNYKGRQENIDEAIPLGKYPVCGWSSDSYINYLTQQSVNIPSKITGIGTNALAYQGRMEAGEMLSKEPQTQLASGMLGLNIAGSILDIVGTFKTASMTSPIQQGGNVGSVHFANNTNNFIYIQKRCKLEFIKQIDDYFTMCGYKICEIKVPNLTGRTNFNYIQISEADDIGYGTVPSVDMDIINKVCRRGVTIWHNHSNLGDYSVTNTIVT